MHIFAAGLLSRDVDICEHSSIKEMKISYVYISKFLVQLLQHLKILYNIGTTEKYRFDRCILVSWLNKFKVIAVKFREGMYFSTVQ